MKTQGFTLVELLAVIVILAVLALIATPVVLSIIDDAKESAMLRSAEMYLSGVENAVMRENMNSGGNFRPSECTITNGNMTCGSTNVEVEVDGEVPSAGTIVFENGKITEVTLNYESGTIVKDSSGNLAYETYIPLDNYQHKHINGTTEKHEVTFDSNGMGTCLKCGAEVLASGLYKEDGTFVSWQLLTSKEYKTISYQAVENGPTLTCALIEVDANGVLVNHTEWKSGSNVSSSELDGVKLVIDDSVKGLNSRVLMDNQKLKEIIIGNNITVLEDDTINNLLSLTTLTIPKSVTTIESYAFSKSPYIDTINYTGTKAEWEKIEKGTDWLEMAYQDVTIKCTDGNIVLEFE